MKNLLFFTCLLCLSCTLSAQVNPEPAKKLLQLLQKQSADNMEVNCIIHYVGESDTSRFQSILFLDSANRYILQENAWHYWVLTDKLVTELDTRKPKVKHHNDALEATDCRTRLAKYYFPALSQEYLKVLQSAKAQVTVYLLGTSSMYHVYLYNGSELEDSYFFFNEKDQLTKRIMTSAGPKRMEQGDNLEYVVNEYSYGTLTAERKNQVRQSVKPLLIKE